MAVALVGGGLRRAHAAHSELADVRRGARGAWRTRAVARACLVTVPLRGWLAGAALFFPFFALGGMGAGDVKLLAALGRLARTRGLGLAGDLRRDRRRRHRPVVVALARGYLRNGVLESLVDAHALARAGPQPVPGLTLKDTKSPRLAYAIPITIGAGVHIMATLKPDSTRAKRAGDHRAGAHAAAAAAGRALGVFDFGLMFQRYEVVTNAAREARACRGAEDRFTINDARTHAAQTTSRPGGISSGSVANDG